MLGGSRSWRTAALTLALLVLGVSASPAGASPLSPPSFQPGPAQYPKTAVTSDVPIAMRDGVKLFADVYRPADADGKAVPGRFPVILTQTPYNKNTGKAASALGSDPLFTTHGYVQVVVDVRGTGSSEGAWNSFDATEQADSMDVARWVDRQPFSDHRLVTYGPSYLAINQILTARQHPPGLKAIFPIVPGEDLYRDVTWHGGDTDFGFIPLWLGIVTAASLEPPNYAGTDPVEALKVMAEHVSPGLNFPVGGLVNGTTQGDLAYDGPFYRVRSPGTYASQVNVPTFIVGGWWDLFQRGEPNLYNDLRLPPTQKKLIMGPWYHLTAAEGQGLGQPGTPPPLDVLALAWFNRWVRGEHNGIDDYNPVTAYQIGTGKWESYNEYPRRDSSYQRWYLSTRQSGSAASLNDGTLTQTPPTSAEATTFPANTVNGICSRESTQWTAALLMPPGTPCETENRTNEATALTYTTPPVSQPMHLSGPQSLTLRGGTTAHNTTWIAQLTDVAPSGQSTEITAGWLVQSFRALDAGRSKLTPAGDAIVPFHPYTKASLLPVNPGETDTLNIEIYNTDAVIQPGHRLRLDILSGDVPHLQSPATEQPDRIGQINTVHSDPKAPSYLTTSVAPLGPEPAAAGRPAAPKCRVPRNLSVRLRHRRGTRIVRVAAYVDGKRRLKKRGRNIGRIVVRGLPQRSVRVKVVAIDSRRHRHVITRRLSC